MFVMLEMLGTEHLADVFDSQNMSIDEERTIHFSIKTVLIPIRKIHILELMFLLVLV